MAQDIENRELRDRLDLIESMIVEGRKMTENWGWAFILWGVAYYIAFAWSFLGWNAAATWPVTMVAAGVITGILSSRMSRGRPGTGMVRAISSIWLVTGVLLFVLMMSLEFSGRLDNHISLSVLGTMLAVANGASSLILKWKVQFACALAWLGAAEVACFGSEEQQLIAFLAATFLCQIVFGIYAMLSESRRRMHGEVHA